MVAVPAETPVTKPKLGFTVAIPGEPLIQVPPVLPFELMNILEPTQTLFCPVMVPAFGFGFTVTV